MVLKSYKILEGFFSLPWFSIFQGFSNFSKVFQNVAGFEWAMNFYEVYLSYFFWAFQDSENVVCTNVEMC